MTIEFKYTAAIDRVNTQEHNCVAKGADWTSSLFAPLALVVPDSDSRGGVLGRRRCSQPNVNTGGHHEQ